MRSEIEKRESLQCTDDVMINKQRSDKSNVMCDQGKAEDAALVPCGSVGDSPQGLASTRGVGPGGVLPMGVLRTSVSMPMKRHHDYTSYTESVLGKTQLPVVAERKVLGV